jgi:hypothetical protein
MRTTIANHRPTILCEVHDCNVALASFMSEIDYDLVNLDQDLPVEEGHRNVHTLGTPRVKAPVGDRHAAQRDNVGYPGATS